MAHRLMPLVILAVLLAPAVALNAQQRSPGTARPEESDHMRQGTTGLLMIPLASEAANPRFASYRQDHANLLWFVHVERSPHRNVGLGGHRSPVPRIPGAQGAGDQVQGPHPCAARHSADREITCPAARALQQGGTVIVRHRGRRAGPHWGAAPTPDG